MLWFERPFLAVLRREYARRHAFRGRRRGRGDARGTRRPCQLYVHVPFCEVLCPFCSFHRVRYDAPKSSRYFEALRREIRLYHQAGFRFSDVYVGGGTPTVNADELLATLALVRSLSPVRTISIETNPNHLDPAPARYAKPGSRACPWACRASTMACSRAWNGSRNTATASRSAGASRPRRACSRRSTWT